MRHPLLAGMALAAVLSAPVSAQIVINEVLPAPGTDWTSNGIFSSSEDEWLELVNSGPQAEDLTGLFLTDGTGTPRIGLSGSLASGELLFLTGEHAVDWETANGYSALGLSLNNSGDTITLFRAAGGTTTQVDTYTYASSATDVSEGRLPVGTGPWASFDALAPGGTSAQPTPGGANGGPASPKILSWEVENQAPKQLQAQYRRYAACEPVHIRFTMTFLHQEEKVAALLDVARELAE